MKGTLFVLFCLSLSYFASAQEASKQQEIGVIFQTFDSFGLTYKTGTEKTLWRFKTLFINGGVKIEPLDDLELTSASLGFGIGFGKEWRKQIVENFELRYGSDLSFSFLHSRLDIDDQSVDVDHFTEQKSYRTGIQFVFGFNYVIQEKLVLGVEVLPGINYNKGTSLQVNPTNGIKTEGDNSGFSYGFSSSSVLLSASYKF